MLRAIGKEELIDKVECPSVCLHRARRIGGDEGKPFEEIKVDYYWIIRTVQRRTPTQRELREASLVTAHDVQNMYDGTGNFLIAPAYYKKGSYEQEKRYAHVIA